MIKKCPACQSVEIINFFEIQKYPVINVPLTKTAVTEITEKYSKNEIYSDLKTAYCENCGHIFLTSIADLDVLNDLYSKYYSYPSAMRGEFTPSRDNRFLNIFDERIIPFLSNKKKTVFEIGCFDGYILSKLKLKGFEVFGCDPSEGADIAVEYGLTNVKRSLFRKDLFNSQKFDIIILRHIIEHSENPIDFIAEIKQILDKDGVLIIELPDTESYLKNGLLEVFSHQHLQYFSSASVLELAQSADMDCKKIFIDNNNLIAVFRGVNAGKNHNIKKISKSVISEFTTKMSDNKKMIIGFIENTEKKGRELAVWGAGGFCSLLINYYAGKYKKNIQYIFDSDKKKYGLSFMEAGIVISEPFNGFKEMNINIILASMYADEILTKLNILNFNGDILILYPDVRIENI